MGNRHILPEYLGPDLYVSKWSLVLLWLPLRQIPLTGFTHIYFKMQNRATFENYVALFSRDPRAPKTVIANEGQHRISHIIKPFS